VGGVPGMRGSGDESGGEKGVAATAGHRRSITVERREVDTAKANRRQITARDNHSRTERRKVDIEKKGGNTEHGGRAIHPRGASKNDHYSVLHQLAENSRSASSHLMPTRSFPLKVSTTFSKSPSSRPILALTAATRSVATRSFLETPAAKVRTDG